MISSDLKPKRICEHVHFKKNKPGLKSLKFDEKWEVLEDTGVEIACDLKNKSIILFDDLYQSGITMQFVAMNLINSGANKIFGLSIVKSRRDKDNLK